MEFQSVLDLEGLDRSTKGQMMSSIHLLFVVRGVNISFFCRHCFFVKQGHQGFETPVWDLKSDFRGVQKRLYLDKVII